MARFAPPSVSVDKANGDESPDYEQVSPLPGGVICLARCIHARASSVHPIHPRALDLLAGVHRHAFINVCSRATLSVSHPLTPTTAITPAARSIPDKTP
jgi:hypothetical protein